MFGKWGGIFETGCCSMFSLACPCLPFINAYLNPKGTEDYLTEGEDLLAAKQEYDFKLNFKQPTKFSVEEMSRELKMGRQ